MSDRVSTSSRASGRFSERAPPSEANPPSRGGQGSSEARADLFGETLDDEYDVDSVEQGQPGAYFYLIQSASQAVFGPRQELLREQLGEALLRVGRYVRQVERAVEAVADGAEFVSPFPHRPELPLLLSHFMSHLRESSFLDNIERTLAEAGPEATPAVRYALLQEYQGLVRDVHGLLFRLLQGLDEHSPEEVLSF